MRVRVRARLRLRLRVRLRLRLGPRLRLRLRLRADGSTWQRTEIMRAPCMKGGKSLCSSSSFSCTVECGNTGAWLE